jgi:ABC-type amino acid transport substrate-binding protein
LEHALTEGVGDIIGYPLIVTPEREKIVSLASPLYSHVKQIIVSGPKAPALSTLEDLSGKEVYVNPLTVYYKNLKLLERIVPKSGQTANPDQECRS